MHSNVPVIKILDEYEDSTGQVWKSGVDENGLFIVAEVRQDIDKGKQTWELIQKGVLTGYSIGGEALLSTTICGETSKCYERIDKMDLHEVAVVDKPANAPSIFKIIKRDNSLEKFIVKDASIDEIKWKIKELIERREKLGKQINPLPWLEKLTDEKKAELESELESIDKELKEYKNGLGIKLADQTLLAKSEIKKDLITELITPSLLKLDIILKRMIGKPFAGYKDFKDCERQNADKKDPGAYCASIMREVEKLDKDGRPPKAGWDNCMRRASAIPSIKDPEAFCGDAFHNKPKVWGAFSKSIAKCGCPVDNVIKKAVWEKLDAALVMLTHKRV